MSERSLMETPPRRHRAPRAAFGRGLAVWAMMALTVAQSGCAVSYLFARPGRLSATDWTDLGPVPEADQRFPPQGLTAVGDELFFTNHWQDQKSVLYRLEPGTMEVLASLELPPEASHTSGLAFDGQDLWAVDYAVGAVYRIDPEASFTEGRVVVTGRFQTGLGGASACTVVRVDGSAYLAVSDFLRTSRTYLIRLEDLPSLAGDLRERAWISYRNGTFSQGLTWDGRYLYEAINNPGVDRVEIMDVAEALRQHDSGLVRRLGSVSAPAPSVEDLAVRDGALWTSDEVSYRFYRIPLERVRPEEH